MSKKEPEFMNWSKFTKLIETQVLEKKLGYIDAIVEVCEITNIDPEDVKKFISPVVKETLEAEAMKLN